MADQVLITYKSYDSASKFLFESLLRNEEFADVSVVCDDERIIKAHKVILSAFSPFFRNILLKISSPHPVIYITGISFKDLLSIFQFIYKGETQVEDSDLQSFFSSAEKLKIMGIYPLPNFEQKKLSNYSQIYPGVLSQEAEENTMPVNGDISPADIGSMLNVVIKEEPPDEPEEQNEKQENVSVFIKTENIQIKEESVTSIKKEEMDALENLSEHIEMKEDPDVKTEGGEIKTEKNLDMYSRIKERHKTSRKKPNYNVDEDDSEDNDNGSEELLVPSKPKIPEQIINHNIPQPHPKFNKLLKCRQCQFKTVNYLLLKKHFHTIHIRPKSGQGLIICNYCGTNFLTVDALNVHKTVVHNVIRA